MYTTREDTLRIAGSIDAWPSTAPAFHALVSVGVHLTMWRPVRAHGAGHAGRMMVESSVMWGASQRTRPWLQWYEDGVPHELTVPDVPVHRLLDDAAERL
ncbi:hypothetical protein ACFQ07_04515, partial [Actinomadura adrarensis]